MKIKVIVTVLLVAIILASCTPAATVVPTETAMPKSTFTSIPPTPTITPTPAPEILADAKDLSKWIDDYVHAYGGKATVNSTEMDSVQLLNAIKTTPDVFIQAKQINGIEYSFLVVNNVPLALKQKDGLKWGKMTLGKLGDMQNFHIGTLFSEPYAPDMELRDRFVVTEFNSARIATLQGAVTEPIQNKFDFVDSDKAVQLAMDNHMYVTGNDVIYGASDFEWGWLKDHAVFDANGKLVSTDLTSDQSIAAIKNHIQQVLTHYKGKVFSWEVVNESGMKAWHPGKWDPYVEIIGENYIDIAFEYARQADPTAVLIYNQNSNETMSSDRYSMTLDIVKRLHSKNLIDNVGLQMHINQSKWNPPSKENMIRAFQSYGIPVAITELDVNMSDATGTDQEKNLKQAEIYKNIFEACIESGVCHNINFWGVGDKYSWYIYALDKPNANPTILNDDLSPKTAYYAITQVLYEHVP